MSPVHWGRQPADDGRTGLNRQLMVKIDQLILF